MNSTRAIKNNAAILLGNFLDHCDTHMYCLLAPFIAQLFFTADEPIIALIKAHSVALSGFITRPIGATIFGNLAYKIGPLMALKWSIIGVSCATFIIGMLPTYNQIGFFAPILLLLVRAMQSICASGEGAIAGLYLTSNNPKQRSFFGSIYCLSTILGGCFASFIVETINSNLNIEVYWRLGFLLGFITSLSAIYIRTSKYESVDIKRETLVQISTFNVVKSNWRNILKISIVYGFSYISYPIAFTLINSILPVIKDISIAETLKLNTNLLLFDGIVIVAAGYIIQFVNIEKFMIGCIFVLAIVESVLLWVIPGACIAKINMIRILVVIFGVFLTVSLEVWIANSTDHCGQEKYLISGLGSGLGAEVFGRCIIVLSLWMFNFSGSFILSSFYVGLLALCAIYSIYSYPKSIKEVIATDEI